MQAAKAGQVEFRAEKAGIVHAGIGKASFEDDKLLENARAFADAIQKAKPTGAKGTYVQKVSLSSTMGPGVRVDVSDASPADASALGTRYAGPLRAGGQEAAAASPNLSETARDPLREV